MVFILYHIIEATHIVKLLIWQLSLILSVNNIANAFKRHRSMIHKVKLGDSNEIFCSFTEGILYISCNKNPGNRNRKKLIDNKRI